MPPYEQCSFSHMLKVIAGRKKALNLNQLIEYNVPWYSKFRLEELMG